MKSTKVDSKVIGKRNKRRGSNYERKIAKELREITGDADICTARSESKRLDDLKIDIADPNNILPFYCQLKATQATPSIKKITEEVGKKDKPLVIFWAALEMRDSKQLCVGEYCVLPKIFFYDLLRGYYGGEI